MVQCNHCHCNVFSILIVLVLLVFNVGAYLDFKFVHIGCFKKNSLDTFSNRHAGTLEFWEECIKRCNSDYAGVNADECFCGEQIANIFEAVDSTDCEVCFTDHSRYCGGSNAFSLYKMSFSRASETTILLATDNDLKMWVFENCTKSFGFYFSEKNGIASVAYNTVDRSIYFVSGSIVFKCLYIDWARMYDVRKIAIQTKCNHVVDLDWVNSEVFWGCEDTKSIIKNGYHQIYSGDSQTFVIEPYRKFLLYVNSTGLVKYNENKFDILELSIFKYVKHIALDVQQERFYFISSYEKEGDKFLVCTDYNFRPYKFVLSGDELSDPFGLDAVNGTVVWGNKKDKNYIVYKSQLSCWNTLEICELVNVTMLFSQTEKINDFKIYTHEAGRPSTNYLCERKNCSHMCIRLSADEVGCRCPGSLVMGEDGTTCIQQLPTTVLASTSTTFTFKVESDHVSTIVGDSSITEKNTLYTTKHSEDNDLAKDQKAYVTSEMKVNTRQPTNSTLEVILKKHESFQKSVYLLIAVSLIVSFITLAISVLFIILPAVRLRRRKSSCERQKQGPELVELSKSAGEKCLGS